MASVYKPRGRRIYRIEFKDQFGATKTVSSDCIDKRVAEGLAHLIEQDAERIRAGMLPERPQITGKHLGLNQIEQQRKQILEVHEMYLADLSRRGKRPATLRHRRLKNGNTFKQCRWHCLADINADSFRSYLTRLNRDSRSPSTCNAYRDSLNAFLSWCVEQEWLAKNPIHAVHRSEGKERPHQRRAFTAEELAALLASAPRHRDRFLFAALTGLRSNEICQVEKRDFDLSAGVWTCRAEVDKTGRIWRLPVLPDLAPDLARMILRLATPTARLFPKRLGNGTFDAQLKRARLVKIGEDGRRLNFHSLRYTFCTLLAKQMPIQNVQRLMRHTDIRRTVNTYLDLGLDDLAQAVNQMPSLFDPTAFPTKAKEPERKAL